MTEFVLKELDESDVLDNFSCKDEDIDFFLKNLALANQKAKFSKTYVLSDKINHKAIAFISLSASQLNTGDARLFGLDKIPGILLGRLGVDSNYQGKELGSFLIKMALEKALEASTIVACRLLLVETSKDMKNYYLEKVSMGFEWFRDKKQFSTLYIDLLKHENNR